jgi:outer membrane protein, multidrug efflux system
LNDPHDCRLILKINGLVNTIKDCGGNNLNQQFTRLDRRQIDFLRYRQDYLMQTNRLTAILATACVGFVLTGCLEVGPDYVKPDSMAPASWQAPADESLSKSKSDSNNLAKWWKNLNDPLLTRFIHQAITGNLDLKQAQIRLVEARAKRDMSWASLFPTVDITGSATKSRSSENRGGGGESNAYSTGFDAGWEVDLFGGGQRSVEASQARVEASREDLRDVLVSLLAETALNYIEFRTYQSRLQIARENLAAQQETYSLIKDRYLGGLTTELAVQQARYLVANTRAQIPSLLTGLGESANQLAILLGRKPGSLDDELQRTKPLPSLPSTIAVGIPADTLQRRPDVRKAERLLAAQTAEIGVAEAELYPSLKLGGSLGLDSLSAGKLFTSGSRSYSIGPNISWPLFDAGALRANIRLQSSLQQEALASYKATVLNALQEVENDLIAYAREQERNKALQESADAAQEASSLAEMQYKAGLTSFSDVLDSRRSLLSFQDQLAQSRGTMIANLVRLYKALGGGWENQEAGARGQETAKADPGIKDMK